MLLATIRTYAKRAGDISRGLAHEMSGGLRLAADVPSLARFASDVLLSRFLPRLPLPNRDRERMIRVRGGIELHYRLNRGDIQSIREVWIDQCYRLPFEAHPRSLVDLGANIGLTSLWFAHRYGCTVLAVEPSPDNARIARLNLERNGVRAEVIEAAVGPRDGTARFDDAVNSNHGHLNAAGEGRPVTVVSMATLLQKVPAGAEVDLVKMDIEGGEGPLLKENLGWLQRVRSLIAEFHPTLIDYPAAIKSIEDQGFRYFPAHSSADFDSMDAFMRTAPGTSG
jgi:FkbM family methyltransferase